MRASEAAVTVLNMWATWCVPCIEEFPDLIRLGKEFESEGVDVVFVSADFEDEWPAARAFLAKQGVTERSYFKDQKDNAFVSAFTDEWSGTLPATMTYDADGQFVDFIEGKSSYEELKRRIQPHLPSR